MREQPADGSMEDLVRGVPEQVERIHFNRGEIRGTAGTLILQHVRHTRSGRVATGAGVVVDRNPDTVRGPDVSYNSKERLPLDLRVVAYHDQPPDLCVEVVSLSNTRKKLREKVKEYFFAGVRAVWVIDPDERSVTVFRAPDESVNPYEGQAVDGGEVLPGFTCPVADFFA